MLGTKSLSEILSDREHIAKDILAHLDAATDAWGIKVRKLFTALSNHNILELKKLVKISHFLKVVLDLNKR